MGKTGFVDGHIVNFIKCKPRCRAIIVKILPLNRYFDSEDQA